jgi:hypothetical protein
MVHEPAVRPPVLVMRRSAAVLGVALIGLSACAEKLPANWATLRGERAEDGVRLLWELTAWPSGVTGFAIRWRDPGEGSGAWQALSPQTIEPGIARAKNLENVEPNVRDREALQAELVRRLESGNAREVSAPDFIATVRDEPEKLEALKREMRQDFRRALLIGLGAIDRGVRSDVVREYGLFPVRSGDRIDAEPAATFLANVFAPGDGRLQVRELAVEPRGQGTIISWRVQTSALDLYAIGSFRVLRGSDLIAAAPPGWARVEDGWSSFTFADQSADSSRSWTYAIEPVSVFGTPMRGRTEFVFRPEPAGALRPARVTASRVPGGVSVSWQAASGRDSAITGFVVQRVVLPDGASVQISPALPPGARSFVDTGARSGASYLYLVASVARGAQHFSAPAAFENVDLAAPPAPDSLRAEVLNVSGRSYIRSRWSPAPAEAGIDGYAVFADKITEGRVSRQVSIPLVRGGEYELEVAPLRTRKYTVGVAAVRHGVVGAMSTVVIEVPGAMEKR